jgi:hypothetical protein
MPDGRPAVCVVVVSDYGGGSAEDWDYLRNGLRALASQAFDEAVELILVDSAPAGQEMPADLTTIAPSMRVIRDRSRSSIELVDLAARTCSADVVALLDADCVPARGWLGAGVAAMRAHPDAAVVSGLTAYPDRRFTFRVLGLLLRSFVDPGRAGATRFVTHNNAMFRRDVLLAHPIPAVEPRHLACRLQTEAIRADGGGFYFEPGMRVTSRQLVTERHVRRRVGYRAIRLRHRPAGGAPGSSASTGSRSSRRRRAYARQLARLRARGAIRRPLVQLPAAFARRRRPPARGRRMRAAFADARAGGRSPAARGPPSAALSR